MVPISLALTNCQRQPRLASSATRNGDGCGCGEIFCKLQYIIASWVEFLGTPDKLDVKGLKLKNEQEDQKKRVK